MNTLNYIIWQADPELVNIAGRSVRYYGLLFALAFVASQQVMYYVYKKDGRERKEVDLLTLYIILGTVIGARLGHCLFYEPAKYLSNPIEILYIWNGGLASHGAAVGILLASWLYVRKLRHKGMTFWWLLDRIVIVVALSGAFIRTGNLMNSEIVGLPTGTESGFVFTRSLTSTLEGIQQVEDVELNKAQAFENQVPGTVPVEVVLTVEKQEGITKELLQRYVETDLATSIIANRRVSEDFALDDTATPTYTVEDRGSYFEVSLMVGGIARHPAQLYEAISSLLLAVLFFLVWKGYGHRLPRGFTFGAFLVLLFSLRILYEFFKENQVAFEDSLRLNMGQLLSVPLVLAGVVIMVLAWRTEKLK